MVEVSRLTKAFNNCFPGRVARVNKELSSLSWRDINRTCGGSEELLWDKMYALLQKGADVNQPAPDGARVLNAVCGQRLHSVAAKLIDAGADVNKANDHGTTPLMMTAYVADPDTMGLLLAKGADPMAVDSEGHSAAWQLVYGGDSKAGKHPQLQARCLKLLLARGVTLTQEEKLEIYHYRPKLAEAVPDVADAMALAEIRTTDDIDTLKELLARGVHPDACTAYGAASPMVSAAYTGNVEKLWLLRQAGADPNLMPPSNVDGPALFLAAQQGKKEAVAALLQMGADPDMKNRRGQTLMEFARKSPGMEEYITDLLAHGAPAPEVTAGADVKVMHNLKLKPRAAVPA